MDAEIERTLEDRGVGGAHAQYRRGTAACGSGLQLVLQVAPIAGAVFVVEQQPVEAGQRCHLGGVGMTQAQPGAGQEATVQGGSADGGVHGAAFCLSYSAGSPVRRRRLVVP